MSAQARRPSVVEDARRRQIVEATVAVVAALGYQRASLSAIAREAGLSKGLLSYHFDDKDALMEHTVLATGTAIRDAVVAGVDLAAPVPDVVRAAVRRAAEYGASHRDELAALAEITMNLRGPDGRHRFTVLDLEPTYAEQERLFLRGQEEGSLRSFDVRVMAVTYQAAIDAMLSYTATHADADVMAYADALADLLVAAVARPT